MGVDAYVFAIIARKYLDIDRRYNVLANACDDEIYEEIHNRLYKPNTMINAVELAYLAGSNVVYWSSAPLEHGNKPIHRVHYNQQLVKFALSFPDDSFFIISDHDEPSNGETCDLYGYTAWEP